MKKVIVKNKVNQITHQAEMQDPTLWIAEQVANNSWGFPERWVADKLLNPLSDEQKALAIDSRLVENQLESYTEYKFAAEYTVEIEDITAQVAEQKAIQKYLARIQFGQRLMAELAAKNKAALDTQSMTQEQVLALKQALGPVKDFLTEGSLGFALAAIQSLNSIPLELKNYFVSLIEDYLLKET